MYIINVPACTLNALLLISITLNAIVDMFRLKSSDMKIKSVTIKDSFDNSKRAHSINDS